MYTPHPKTIFFDWNKTLSHSRFWEQLEDPAHPHHHDGKRAVRFLFNERRSLIKPWMRAEVSTPEILKEIAQATGVSYDLLFEELKLSCENMKLVSDTVVDQIQELRTRGVRCVIASDNMDTFRDFTLPKLKLDEIFDDFLLSNELGVLKHDVDKAGRKIPFFDDYLEKHNLKYDEVVLLDDTLDDGFYADMGLRMVHIMRPEDLHEYLDTIRGNTGRNPLSGTVV